MMSLIVLAIFLLALMQSTESFGFGGLKTNRVARTALSMVRTYKFSIVAIG